MSLRLYASRHAETREAYSLQGGYVGRHKKEFCKRGHARIPENLYGRNCKICRALLPRKERDKAYREAHTEQVQRVGRESKRRWHLAHPEEHARRSKQWRIDNPEKAREKDRRRRSLENHSEGSFTDAEWKSLCDSFGNVCLCCGSTETLEPDHVLPISKGGSSYISNIQPLCKSCNSSKCDKYKDYREQRATVK